MAHNEFMFRAPEYIYKQSLPSAKTTAIAQNKWLMINLQDPADFCCLALNRDIWRDRQLKTIIPKSFIFYQSLIDSTITQSVNKLYNPSKIPCILVIEPCADFQIHEFIISDNSMEIIELKPKILNFLKEYSNPNAYWQEFRSLVYGYTRQQIIKNKITQQIPLEIMELFFTYFCPANSYSNKTINRQNKGLYQMKNDEFWDLVKMAITLLDIPLNQKKIIKYFKHNIGPKYFTTLTTKTFCNQMEYIKMNRVDATRLFAKIRDLMEF